MRFKLFTTFIILILLGASAGSFWYAYKLNQTEQKNLNEKISDLQKQLSSLSERLAGSASSTQSQLASLSQQEVNNRQVVIQKSQDQLLTEAVAKISPSVVSIVESQDVPNYQVVYVNPFGDDPAFQNSGVLVPQYVQNGTTHQQVSAGTGSLITADGYILTNKHVVPDQQADYTVLLSNGKQLSGSVVYRDATNDLAIVKITGSGYHAVNLADSSALQLGQTVFAVGNALGQYNNSVSVGVISGLNRSIQAGEQNGTTETLSGVIQTDAAINPGNSGGPLSDLNGNVVGVNVATVQGSSNVSFSIPINQVKQIIKSVIGK